MGMIDKKYWVLYGEETLGVTPDEERVGEILQTAYLAEKDLPEEFRERLGVRMKFDTYRLTLDGMDVPGFYASNEPEL